MATQNYIKFTGKVQDVKLRQSRGQPEQYVIQLENADVCTKCFVRKELAPPILLNGMTICVEGFLRETNEYISLSAFLEVVGQSSRLTDNDRLVSLSLNTVSIIATSATLVTELSAKTLVDVKGIIIPNSIERTSNAVSFKLAFYDPQSPIITSGAGAGKQRASYCNVALRKSDFPKHFATLDTTIKSGVKYGIDGELAGTERTFSLKWALQKAEQAMRIADGDDKLFVSRPTNLVICKRMAELTK